MQKQHKYTVQQVGIYFLVSVILGEFRKKKERKQTVALKWQQ